MFAVMTMVDAVAVDNYAWPVGLHQRRVVETGGDG